MTGTRERVSNIGDISEVNYTLGFAKMKRPVIAILLSVPIIAGCFIETHSKVVQVQRPCEFLKRSGRTTVEMLFNFYGRDRKPDETRKLDNSRAEFVFYNTLLGQNDPRHWS